MTRLEKARIVCQRVAARIREVVPPGLGHWGPVWTFIADSSDVFMDALEEWKAEETPLTRFGLQAAIAGLIKAWKEGARQWEAAGCPTLGDTSDREVEAGVGECVS